ncbi:Gfo/Idh/MocA family protein [Hellea balneolensis]|uniref:Gfo/Idh/MocA family protein n=1 Tax=Hellea balneolensis TaxID=287478 RepID=UPI000417DEC1|nr:Gfo/Idh/MocA family oxidoreductase [Hellea balneolensis]
MVDKNTRRYGLIGAGMMGREHIQNIKIVDGPELVAIADPDAGSLTSSGKLAGQKVNQYEDYMEMMASENLDAVIIASPNFTHYKIVSDIAEFGTALLIEKPLCTTVADAKALANLSKTHPAIMWTGLEYRYMPPITEFIRHVHSGLTGKPRMISIREHRFPFLKKVGDWNRFSENTGGTLVEKCCHFFDLMRVIMQEEPVQIFASGAQDVNHLDERYDGRIPDILDNAYVIVDFKSGARGVLDLCMFANDKEQQEDIYTLGDKGRLDVKIPGADLTWTPRSLKSGWTEHIETPPHALAAGDHHGATYFQLKDFQHAVITGAKPTVTALDGLRSVEMGAAAHLSIETGRAIKLNFET